MPSTSAPTCGDEKCHKLADIWSEMWSGGRGVNWQQRQSMECAQCSQEWTRRCCVLRNTEEDNGRFVSEGFAAAPYVHSFRHPSYHATQLRALVCAKNASRRLHWIVADDTMADKSQACRNPEKAEQRKEQWLEYHDRVTGGIPGLAKNHMHCVHTSILEDGYVAGSCQKMKSTSCNKFRIQKFS